MKAKLIAIMTCILLAGCSTAKPYAKFAAGYQINEWTDELLSTEQSYECSENLPFQGELGVEWKNGWSAWYEHTSWFLCGGPFYPERPETYRDVIWVGKKFGGYSD